MDPLPPKKEILEAAYKEERRIETELMNQLREEDDNLDNGPQSLAVFAAVIVGSLLLVLLAYVLAHKR